MRETNKFELDKIKKRYSDSLSFKIQPIWDLPDPKLYSPYKNSWDSEDKLRFKLILSVSIDRLFTSLDDSYLEIFKTPGLFHNRVNENKVCGILNRWEQGLPVDPPIMLWNSNSDKIMIDNGIHRLNTAIKLGALHVPIIVTTQNYLEIHSQLKE